MMLSIELKLKLYIHFSMNDRSDHPGKGMDLSYDEILRINISPEGLVHKGVIWCKKRIH